MIQPSGTIAVSGFIRADQHEAFLKEKKPKPSAAFKAPPTLPTPSALQPYDAVQVGRAFGATSPRFHKPGETKPSSLYNL